MKAANDITDHKLTRLTDAWKHAKQQEAYWNEQRIAIESDIYELTRESLPEKGTYTTETGMKIATGYVEDWDQVQVTRARNLWPDESKIPFPFASIFKPDSRQITYIRDNMPELYAVIRPALTLKLKKPAFSIKGD